MSSTVSVGSMEITSNAESADSMVAALTPEKDDANTPRVLVENGEPVEQETPDEELSDEERVSKAASELGKKGGKAAAEAREAKAKEAAKAERKAKPIPDKKADDEPSDEDAVAEAERLEKEGKLGKPRDDPRARMLKATREAAALKDQLARERSERERLADEVARERASKAAAPAPAAAAPAARKDDPDPEPQQEDFDDYSKFIAATARWNARREFSQREQAAAKERQAQERDQRVRSSVRTFQERHAKAVEADPNYTKRTADVALKLQPSFLLPPDQPVRPVNAVADFVINSEHGPALMLHFADHPDDLSALERSTSVAQLMHQLGKIEARLEAATAGDSPRPREVSRANPPVRPVTGSPHTASDDELDDSAPLSAFVRRNAERAARQR